MQVIEEEDEGPLARHSDKKVAQLGEERLLAGAFDDTRRRAVVHLIEHLDPRPVRRRLGAVVAAPDENARPPRGGLPAHRSRERSFADPRLAADQYEAAPPGARSITMLLEHATFALPPDESGRR
jgi:hypothetical protein